MSEDQPQLVALVIDDEVQIRRLLRVSLEASGFRVFEAADGAVGLAETARRRPDVVVLDLGLSDMDGFEVLKRIREWSDVPIIVVTVRGAEDDKVLALDSGADDYLTKPFNVRELLARIRVARRHDRSHLDPVLFKGGPLEVNLATREVRVNDRPVRLTMTEFSLLRLFVRHAGKVLTHRQIMQQIWGPANVDRTNYLHVYMAHLRAKIEPNPALPVLLINEMRVGYRLAIPEE